LKKYVPKKRIRREKITKKEYTVTENNFAVEGKTKEGGKNHWSLPVKEKGGRKTKSLHPPVGRSCGAGRN